VFARHVYTARAEGYLVDGRGFGPLTGLVPETASGTARRPLNERKRLTSTSTPFSPRNNSVGSMVAAVLECRRISASLRSPREVVIHKMPGGCYPLGIVVLAQFQSRNHCSACRTP